MRPLPPPILEQDLGSVPLAGTAIRPRRDALMRVRMIVFMAIPLSIDVLGSPGHHGEELDPFLVEQKRQQGTAYCKRWAACGRDAVNFFQLQSDHVRMPNGGTAADRQHDRTTARSGIATLPFRCTWDTAVR